MKTFISWSGDVSREVGAALKEWLRLVFQDIEPWMSDHDIQAGSTWGADLNKELEELKFGIFCLTPDNLNSRWLLFEAGALSKGLGSARVVPYRFKLAATDVAAPLSQFQGVDADRPGTWKLVQSMNKNKERPLDKELLVQTFGMWWTKLETALEEINFSSPAAPIREDSEILGEVLDETRKLRRHSEETMKRNQEGLAALMLLQQGYDIVRIAKDKQFGRAVVAWSSIAPHPEELLQQLTIEEASEFVKLGYNIPEVLGRLLQSLLPGQDLGSSDWRDREYIDGLVAEAKSLATPYLVKALGTNSEGELRHAAYLLGLTRDASAISALTPLLLDTRPGVCDAAAGALKEIGTPEALAALDRLEKTSGGSEQR